MSEVPSPLLDHDIFGRGSIGKAVQAATRGVGKRLTGTFSLRGGNEIFSVSYFAE